jgi:hypothetical protein
LPDDSQTKGRQGFLINRPTPSDPAGNWGRWIIGALVLVSGCAPQGPVRQSEIHVTCPHVPAPPPGAKPPLPPVSAFPQMLQPGHWDWSDAQYVWTPPQWQARFDARPRRWQNGHWEVNGGACVWQNGAFLSAAPGQAGKIPQ